MLFLPLIILPALVALAGHGFDAPRRNRLALLGAACLLITAALPLLQAIGWSALQWHQLLPMMLCAFIGAVCCRFAERYMRADANAGAFALRIGLLLTSALLFLGADQLALFLVAWVASGQLLASLIGHVRGWDAAAIAARRARITFLIGDAALTAALALLAARANSLSMAALAAEAGTLDAATATAIGALMLIAAAARCALPPFSGWLMGSMTAPTPVSALMHAGLVNAGGFLLIAFAGLFDAAPALSIATVIIGAVAAIHGVLLMSLRPEIKTGLAGSTVAQMGFMILTIGLGAYAAALFHLIGHGLFKAWLFLRSGSAVVVPGTRPIDTLSSNRIALIALATALAFGGAIATGFTSAALLPLVLLIATALGSLAGMSRLSGLSSRLAALRLTAAAFGCQIAGVTALHSLLPSPTPDRAMIALQSALLIAFLLLWWVQARTIEGRLVLPASLYARLLSLTPQR